MIRSVFRHFSILVDNQNLVWKKNSMRQLVVTGKLSSVCFSLCDPKELTQAPVNVWLLWPFVWINDKYVYNS